MDNLHRELDKSVNAGKSAFTGLLWATLIGLTVWILGIAAIVGWLS
ncbi:hypothetical protein SEA_YEET_227 [Mycobacterium phage Yeet]|nr:hypothetical protein SEA_HALLEY_235 [Mycobacterium phage Halley]QBJ00176.1 hypothetical protein SEA_PHOEBUS_231 [Mycobacterium phage Phoebus]QDM55809.1 hypothetical protein SEA_HOKKEND_225 [Mycobacterium phage HokkenD]QDP43973.1 hypothetical protein SEA_DALLAS_231 [Mycobacterium phage Dallas]QED12379.1 hypothetical protein SEA_YEET_227 [Mycobacterium phage Yeet]